MKEQNKMKKLICAVAGLAMCIAANASTYSWNGIATAILTDQYGPLSGTFYAFDATQYSIATVSEALTTTGAAMLDNSLNSAAVSEAILDAIGGTADTPSGISANSDNKLALYGILVDTAGKNFAVIDTAAVVPLNASIEAGSPAVFDFGMPTIADGQWQEIATTPEPTSGLLLLLGVAGLALKRKRA